MGIREKRDMGEMSNFEEFRDKYLRGKLWKIGDVVEANGYIGKIINRGTNYLSFVDEDNKVYKVWLHEVTILERDYKKEYSNYHSKPEQIERRSSRNKARRVMGDKTKVGMDVGHKDNNPLNNDPKNLRNENPSKNRKEPRLRKKEFKEFTNSFQKEKLNVAEEIVESTEYNKKVVDLNNPIQKGKGK